MLQPNKIKIRTVPKASGNKIPKPSRQEKPERPEKLERSERPDKSEKPGRPEKPEKRGLVLKMKLPPAKLAIVALPPHQRPYKFGSSLKRKAEGVPDGANHNLKRQSVSPTFNGTSGGDRKRSSLIVKLRLGREKCRYVREKYRERDGQ